MTYTTAANPDILIRSDASTPLPNNAIAAGSWPMNGKPGPSIWINLDYDYNKTIPRLQKIYNMVHELGHCFGLRHTNWKSRNESNAYDIYGTPDSDSYSVMNGGTAEYQWSGFSEGDKKAIEYLYPSTFTADFVGYPQEVKHWGVDVHRLSVRGSHPIVGYEIGIRLVGGLSVLMMIQRILFWKPIYFWCLCSCYDYLWRKVFLEKGVYRSNY